MTTKEEIALMATLPQKGPCFGAADTNAPPPKEPSDENIAFANELVDELRSSLLVPDKPKS